MYFSFLSHVLQHYRLVKKVSLHFLDYLDKFLLEQ